MIDYNPRIATKVKFFGYKGVTIDNLSSLNEEIVRNTKCSTSHLRQTLSYSGMNCYSLDSIWGKKNGVRVILALGENGIDVTVIFLILST